ncbi:MAG: hypothetical protein ACI92E_002685, partial [Oceanicoccus sp.]
CILVTSIDTDAPQKNQLHLQLVFLWGHADHVNVT